jgi:predicted glycosyltransferase
MLAISEHLLETLPDVSVLLVTGSPMVHQFRLRPGLDYIKLPCLSRVANDEYSAKSLGTGIDQLIQLRSGLVLSAARDYNPDVVLIDKKPDGVRHELRPTLRHLLATRPDCRIALVLRDILDTPESTISQWRDRGYESVLREYFHSVLILGSSEVFDAPREYQFSRQLRRATHFAGYLRRPGSPADSACLRTRILQGSEQRLVLVTPGGGEDGFTLVRSYVAGMHFLHGVHSVIVCGPEMPQAQRQIIAQLLQERRDVTVSDFTGDMMTLMGAADVVVSMAGYNTICEVLSLNKRAVTVPRVRPVQEQWIRAERLARLGLIDAIHPDVLTPERLAAAVRTQLERKDHDLPRLAKQDGLSAVARWVEQNAPRPSAAVACIQQPRMTWNTPLLTY